MKKIILTVFLIVIAVALFKVYSVYSGYQAFKTTKIEVPAGTTVVIEKGNTWNSAAKKLAEENISCEVICSHTVKPLDEKTIVDSARKTGAVVTCENHNAMGALRSAVCEALCENYPVPVRSVAVKEQFGEVGKVPYLRKVFHMEEIDVITAVKNVLQTK